MHALPGIVDGARKNSQGGSWIWVGTSLPMLEATTSRDQCMSAVSIVHHGVRASSAVDRAQRISRFNPRRPGEGAAGGAIYCLVTISQAVRWE